MGWAKAVPGLFISILILKIKYDRVESEGEI